ncbi:UDP-N-acetylmuramate dehydrogenase [Candidatus Saccharibacteria bacterium]|nr:UDP-N-acetylmuramate dehydrogenase [Candidatus Saccharibacteria bacterium]
MLEENVKISSLTTMKIGGPARYVAEVEEVGEIAKWLDFAEDKGLPVFLMGAGANIIGRDEGFDGVVLMCKIRGFEVLEQTAREITVRVGAGEILDDIVKILSERGYTGVEGLASIPGTVGAAPVQNVGAYGQEIEQVLERVESYDMQERQMREFGHDECGFAYRQSIFNHGPNAGRYFITHVVLKLKKGELKPPFYTSLQRYLEEHNIKDYSPESIRRAVAAVREVKLPDPRFEASAGSFFKNIYLSDEEAEAARERGIEVWRERGQNIVNSGWLIQQAGLSGRTFYGVRVSEKAALILINDHARGYSDLARARERIVWAVEKQFGYRLEQEPVEMVAGGEREVA